MRMFEPVVIACDSTSLDVALAIRGALELFRLPVYMHFCVQKRNVLDVLAGRIPDSEYVVLALHSCVAYSSQIDEPSMSTVVEEVDGRWQPWRLDLTPQTIREVVQLEGRKVVNVVCDSGSPEVAQAFLDAGCAAYIGADGGVDQDACALFTIGFFYHLLSAERHESLLTTDEEAVALAAAADTRWKGGTQVFRYYAP
jgi:hypothetical protein